jgi:outer membrane protein assembly factor BamB
VFPQPADRVHRKNSHASPTPIVLGERLFVHFGTHGTACLTTGGEVVWKQSAIRYDMVHGTGGSPVLADGRLVFSCDGGDEAFVVALDAATGKVAWRKDRPAVTNPKTFSFGTPLVIETGGRKQIVSPGSDQAIAYDPRSGEELWSVDYDGYSVIPRPVFGHGLLFLSTSYDRPKLLAVRVPDGRVPAGPADGQPAEAEIAWQAGRGAPHTPSPLLVGSELYTVSDGGIAGCYDALTGEVHWQERLGGNYSASPLFGDGKVYFQSEQGVGTVVAAGTTFQKLAENDLKSRTLASYAVVGSDLLIRTDTALYRIAR